MSSLERDLPHQPWLEHAMSLVLEPGKDALRRGHGAAPEIRAVFAAGYALGRMLEWHAFVQRKAPDLLKDAMAAGMQSGRLSYCPPKITQAA